MGDNSEDITRFMSFTNVSFNVAKNYLDSYGDLNTAMEAYYEDQKDLFEETREKEKLHGILETDIINKERQTSLHSKTPSVSSSTTNSRPISRNSNNSHKANPKFMSFSDMLRSNAAENDDDDDDSKPRNTFAGGETSGLEITDPGNNGSDPNSLIRDLLEKAKRNGEQMDDLRSSNAIGNNGSKSSFVGKGYRLGSMVDSPSEVVEDFSESNDNNVGVEKVTREITFWKDGFQVGSEGKLYRYDDPANEFYLKELNQGRAPLKLLDVKFGQEVEVNVFKKLDENYKPPKRKLGGFYGKGQRLGSPIPGDTIPTLNSNNNQHNDTSNSKESNTPQVHTDMTIQIRYATGKREVYHCNSTDNVSSLYKHVKSNTDDPSRNFTLNYAFPIKPIENMDQTLLEADLKNSVVVQRWV